MKTFYDLLDLRDHLLGENGCIWDKKQDLDSLKGYLIEEAKEVFDAINNRDIPNIKEELGDLLYIIIFVAKVASIDMGEVIDSIYRKMRRRHPHIFAGKRADSLEDIEKNWNEIKEGERR